jgi:hypothetical protein
MLPLEELLNDAAADIFFCVLFSPQFGQVGVKSASEKLTSSSKDFPQLLHLYSYNGIVMIPLF